MLYSFDGDSRAPTHAALPQPAGPPDGADENQNQRAADGSWRELQQGAIAQGSYFRELLATNPDIDEGLRSLLRQCRETVVRLSKIESAMIRSLRHDGLLTERMERLMSIPWAGPITALTWALEIGDVQRFSSIKKAVSYCGLCGAEKSSGNLVQRTPLSKQRNKHLQTTLIEAAKMAPRYSPSLALLHDRERQRGNANRATLAVARKLVAYLVAVDRGKTPFLVANREACAA